MWMDHPSPPISSPDRVSLSLETMWEMGNKWWFSVVMPSDPQPRIRRRDYGAYNSCRADSTRSRNWRSR